jgi:hypothetical protein
MHNTLSSIPTTTNERKKGLKEGIKEGRKGGKDGGRMEGKGKKERRKEREGGRKKEKEKKEKGKRMGGMYRCGGQLSEISKKLKYQSTGKRRIMKECAILLLI